MAESSDDSSIFETPELDEIVVMVILVIALTLSYALFPVLADSAPLNNEFGVESNSGGDNLTGDNTQSDDNLTNNSNQSGDASSGTAGGSLSRASSYRISGRLYRNQNASILFVGHSPHRVYWRQDAYQTFTGTGWKRKEGLDRFTSESRDVQRTSETFSTTVQLHGEATALPTVWEPTAYHNLSQPVYTTATGGLKTKKPVPAGTSYELEVSRPVRDQETLRKTELDPTGINSTYTQLPENTSPLISQFTESITEDAETPYGKARAIEHWLESNKEYSLNISRPKDENIVNSFIFDMEKGYCQYFASSMVVMLRSQGIPARYVAGFAPGEKVDNNTYVVRENKGHAWVEVFISDVGWVRMDPTPLDGRTAADRRQRAKSDQSFSEVSDQYSLELNRSLKPGVAVTVTVRRGRQSAGGVQVQFNGELVGTTNEAGNVTAQVPYDENLTISLKNQPVRTSFGLPPKTNFQRSAESQSSRQTLAATTQANDEDKTNSGYTETFQLPSNVSFRIQDTPVSGHPITIQVLVADVPLRNGTVKLNGTSMGRTDDNGTIQFRIPTSVGNTAMLTAERGEIQGQKQLRIDAKPPIANAGPNLTVHSFEEFTLNGSASHDDTRITNYSWDVDNDDIFELTGQTVTHNYSQTGSRTVRLRVEDAAENTDTDTVRISVEPQNTTVELSIEPPAPLPVALPGMPVAVSVTQNGTPVENARILINDQLVGSTTNGTLILSLPLANQATIQASYQGSRATTQLSGLFRNLAIIVVAAVLLLFATYKILTRYFETLNRLFHFILSMVYYARDKFPNAIVSIAHYLGDILEEIRVMSLLEVCHRLRKSLPTLSLAVLITNSKSSLDKLRLFILHLLQDTEHQQGVDNTSTAVSFSESAQDTDPPPIMTIREVWREFIRQVHPSQLHTRTPGEVARYAIGQGYPEQPVFTITEAFRETEYGNRTPSESTLTHAGNALDRIENSQESYPSHGTQGSDNPEDDTESKTGDSEGDGSQ